MSRLAGGAQRLALVAFCVSGIGTTLWTADWFSGDALIHIPVIANSARGEWFAFNAGEHGGASSSPLLTLLGAGVWRIAGIVGYVVFVKLASLLSWVGVGLAAYALGRRLGAAKADALLGAAIATGLPGSVWNWHQGSENGLFAAVVMLQLALLARLLAMRPTYFANASVFALGGVGLALRPEGLAPLAASAWVVWRHLRAKRSGAPMVHVAVASIAACAVALPVYWLQHAHLGEWIASASTSRVMMARRQPTAFNIAGLWCYPRGALRLLWYAPLVALAWKAARAGGSARPLRHAISATTVLGLFAYTFVIGAAHTGRYLIWISALIAALAAAGLTVLRSQVNARRSAIALAMVWLVGACVVEAGARFARFRPNMQVSSLLHAWDTRHEHTDALLAGVCALGCCTGAPKPAVARVAIEGQVTLDERVSTRSLDGVGPGPGGRSVRFRADGCPIVDDFFEDPQVVAFVDAPIGSAFYDCAYQGRPAILARGLNGPVGEDRPEAPPGWAWADPPRRMLVRDCHATSTRDRPAR